MRYERTDSFLRDCKKLQKVPELWALVQAFIPGFNDCCEAYRLDSLAPWPTEFDCHPLAHCGGQIWKVTISFKRPDLRATFEWIEVEVDGVLELGLRWRRIGTHAVYDDP